MNKIPRQKGVSFEQYCRLEIDVDCQSVVMTPRREDLSAAGYKLLRAKRQEGQS
jgi:hypothetical protein